MKICQREQVAWLLLFSCISYVECLVCLKCDTTIKPIICQDVEHCGPHEVCQTEAFITPSGGVKYKVGCVDRLFCISSPNVGKRDTIHGLKEDNSSSSPDIHKQVIQRDQRDTQFCSECCDGDLCNAGGCGNKGYDSSLGPVCYSCPTQVGPGGCKHIQQCGRDKICMINPQIVPGVTDAYTSLCEHQRDFTSVHLPIGGGAYACSASCNQSLCNSFNTSDDVCKYQSNMMTSTSTSGPSSRSPTSPVSMSVSTTAMKTSASTITTSPLEVHSLLTSTRLAPTTRSKPTTTMITSATQFPCSACAKFHPEIVCSTNTSLVRSCVQHCGWSCPGLQTTQVPCSVCAKFHPEIVCSTNTSLVRSCVQHCGWSCPGLHF